MQADEQARELLKNTLQHPISSTAEDLLNVSEPVRLELKKLLTKWHIEKKSVTFTGEMSKVDGPWRDLSGTSTRNSISELPEATCEILNDDCEEMKLSSSYLEKTQFALLQSTQLLIKVFK